MKHKTYIILALSIGIIALVYFLYPKDKFEGILTNEVYLCPNNKEIIFVYEKDNISSIYIFKVGGKHSKLLVRNSGYNLSEPSFTVDGKKIIYRAWKKNDPIIHIFVCNADGSKSEEIYKGNLIFSPKFSEHNPEEIYFIKATEYSNHSPIATQHPNGMDLYCYNLKSKTTTKITHDNYYAINSYDFIDNNNFVLNCDLTGIFKYSARNFKKEKLNIEGIIDSSSIDQIYSNKVSYSKVENKYLLSSNFEVYTWDGGNSKPIIIFTSEPGIQIQSTSFFKNEKRIFLSDNIENITIIDYQGKVFKKFKIPIPKF